MINSQTNFNETQENLNANKLIDNKIASKLNYSSDTNISHLPLEKSTNSNMESEKDVNNLNQKNEPAPQKSRPGIFGRFANYLKSFWEIEEEEYIDAHGFVSKRPKKKIPLRNKEASDRNNVQVEGASGLNYATQHSGFGRMFL